MPSLKVQGGSVGRTLRIQTLGTHISQWSAFRPGRLYSSRLFPNDGHCYVTNCCLSCQEPQCLRCALKSSFRYPRGSGMNTCKYFTTITPTEFCLVSVQVIADARHLGSHDILSYNFVCIFSPVLGLEEILPRGIRLCFHISHRKEQFN